MIPHISLQHNNGANLGLQVVEAVNSSQRKNAMIFNVLFQLHTAVTNLLPSIPPAAIEHIDDALKQLAK